MSGVLLAALLAAGPAAAAGFGERAEPKPSYGLLLLASDAGSGWKKDLAALRAQLKGMAVESVAGAADPVAVQKAVDKLERQRPGKIVAVSLEPLSESPVTQEARFLLGVREQPAEDRPDADSERLSGGMKSSLVLETARPRWLKRVKSASPIVMTATLDQSPLLAAILADRARKLSRDPRRDTVLLVGQGPRSDKALKSWQAAADAVAEQVRAKGGFARAAAVPVRDGVRSGQRDKDRESLKAKLSELAVTGGIVAVPLAPDGRRLEHLLRQSAGSTAYRWDGQGVLGDARLLEWIRSAAAAASKLPDGRRYKDSAGGAETMRRP
ncbi:MAG: hypothetical protein SF051_04935 [Elusimicrobiota bacterium]|nr:hypothetical protein [Elusimicrobiota bacterium]